MSRLWRYWAPAGGALLAALCSAAWVYDGRFFSERLISACLPLGSALNLVSVATLIMLFLAWSHARPRAEDLGVAVHFANLAIGVMLMIVCNAVTMANLGRNFALVLWWAAAGYISVALGLALLLITDVMLKRPLP